MNRISLTVGLPTLACLLCPTTLFGQERGKIAEEQDKRLRAAYRLIDVYMDRLMTWHGTPGMAMAVTLRDALLHTRVRGYADKKAKRLVTQSTLYQIGSITKSFTAIALLQQQEQGRFDPMKPVTTWLPWFAVKTAFAPILCHHLLTHTAGIPGNRDDMTHGPYQAWVLREQETAWKPGERYDDRPAHRSHPLVECQFVEYGIGDGCIVSTADDLAAYVRMLLSRGEAPDGRVLSKESFERFIDGGKFGYGMRVGRVDGRTVLRHTGGMVGITASLVADLDAGVGIVAFANGPGAPAKLTRYALEVVRSARAAVVLPKLPDPSLKTVVEKPERFQGSYTGDGGRFEIVVDGGALVLVRGEEKIPLERVGDAAFHTPHRAFDRFFLRFAGAGEQGITYVTHGSHWYANENYEGKRKFSVPAEWNQFAGHYRSFSPWTSNFSVIVRRGELFLVTAEGGETSVSERALVPRPQGGFFIGQRPTPEVVLFDTLVDGHTLRAFLSGHVFHRTP